MRKRALLAAASAGAVAGMIAGAAAGLGARAAMRMVADGVPDGLMQRPDFTLPGTTLIVLLGAIAGAPIGVVYNVVADRLPGPARLRGLLFGGLCLASFGPFFLTAGELFTTGRVLLFAALFPLFGVVLGLALAPCRRRAPGLPLPAQAGLALASLASAALAAIQLLAAAIGVGGAFAM